MKTKTKTAFFAEKEKEFGGVAGGWKKRGGHPNREGEGEENGGPCEGGGS